VLCSLGRQQCIFFLSESSKIPTLLGKAERDALTLPCRTPLFQRGIVQAAVRFTLGV
jgi:hypothetical protein